MWYLKRERRAHGAGGRAPFDDPHPSMWACVTGLRLLILGRGNRRRDGLVYIAVMRHHPPASEKAMLNREQAEGGHNAQSPPTPALLRNSVPGCKTTFHGAVSWEISRCQALSIRKVDG